MPVIAARSDRLNCPRAGSLSCLKLDPSCLAKFRKKTSVVDPFSF
jgi:hypothetical protein